MEEHSHLAEKEHEAAGAAYIAATGRRRSSIIEIADYRNEKRLAAGKMFYGASKLRSSVLVTDYEPKGGVRRRGTSKLTYVIASFL